MYSIRVNDRYRICFSWREGNAYDVEQSEERMDKDTYRIDLGTFGDYIKEDWMEPLGLSAYRLAKDIGISSAALGKILAGKNRMSNDVCWRLARYFGTSPNFFLTVQADYELRNSMDLFLKETEDLPVYNWGG